jgi:hypothetical protein
MPEMTNLAAHRKDRTVALAAALVLLLQAFFTAWTTGAMASGNMPVDAWGNPLCITSADEGGAPAHETGVKLPNCCVLGCSVAAATMPHPPLAHEAVRVHLSGTEIRFFATNPPLGTSRDHDPGSPRAPPLTA